MNKVPQSGEQPEQAPVSVSLLVPFHLWKQVKSTAADQRASAQSIWLTAMQEYLARHGRATSAA